MNKQIALAKQFRALHVPHNPVVLYNIWDSGSAKAIATAGAKAIATGSWSVAAAQGHADGEEMPLNDVLSVVRRIIKTVELPVTVDFEGGYAADPETIMKNVHQLLDLGAIGINFEDQIVDGSGLYSIEDQVARIRAVRRAMEDHGIPGFINARTDLFLKAASNTDHSSLLGETVARGAAYAEAGADGFFVPGLEDGTLIQQVCAQVALPVNVMMSGSSEEVGKIAKLGVARVSFGPTPYRRYIADLEQQASAYF